MKNKKLIFVFFGFFIFLCSILAGAMIVIDPLSIFHKPIICKEKIESDTRKGDYAIINAYEFDGMIFGTSMLENTSAKEASQILGGNFMNLSIAGSSFYEREMILNYIFNVKKKNIKQIIYSLDSDKYLRLLKETATTNPRQMQYLYDENKFNDYLVYFEKYLFMAALRNVASCQKSDIYRPTAWYKEKSFEIRFGGFENWVKNKDDGQIKSSFQAIKTAISQIKNGKIQSLANLNEQIVNSKKYIDEYLLKFVANEPDTEFLIVVPPYSRIHNYIEIRTKPNDFLTTKEVLRYLVQKSSEFKNLKIYAWGDTGYPDDIANYKDLTHYSHKFNSLMLSYIRDDIGLLTPENFEKYYAEFEQKSLEFDIMPYYEKIKDFIK